MTLSWLPVVRCIAKSQSLPDIGASDLAVTALETLGVLRPSKIQVRRVIICPCQQHRLFIWHLVNRAWCVILLMSWVARVLEDSTILAHTGGADLALLDVALSFWCTGTPSLATVRSEPQRCAFRAWLRVLFVLPG